MGMRPARKTQSEMPMASQAALQRGCCLRAGLEPAQLLDKSAARCRESAFVPTSCHRRFGRTWTARGLRVAQLPSVLLCCMIWLSRKAGRQLPMC